MNPYEMLVQQAQPRGVGAVIPMEQRGVVRETSVNPGNSGARDAGKAAPTLFGIPIFVVLALGAVALFMLPSGK